MKTYTFWLLWLVSLVGASLANRMVSVRSAGDFYAKVRPRVSSQTTLAAVLFYDASMGAFSQKVLRGKTRDERKLIRDHRERLSKRIKAQREAFAQAGKAVQEVDFIAVDLSRKDASSLQRAYRLKQFPVVVLFNKGRLLVNKEQKMITLQGNFSQERVFEVDDIIAFIQRYFGKEIQKIVKLKAQAEFELAKARASAPRVYAPYWGWGYGWGYPGWGYWGWCGGGWCW